MKCDESQLFHNIFKKAQKLYSRVVYITTALKILQCNRQCRSRACSAQIGGQD